MSDIRLAGPSASCSSCVVRTLMLDITHKLYDQIFSYLPCLQAPLTSIPLSLALTLLGGHKVSVNQNL